MATSDQPKYLAVSQAIEHQIRTAKGPGTQIPSTRDIAEEHGVSVVTASRALQVLRDKGLISIQGRSRSVLVTQKAANSSRGNDPKERPVERLGVFLRSTPGPWQAASQSVPLNGFVNAAKENGVRLDLNLFELAESTTRVEIDRQVQRAADRNLKGIFFMPSRHGEAPARQDELFLEACSKAGIVVVLVERNLRGPDRPLGHDLVATDDLDGGLVSTRHLIDQGRQRIAFVTGSPTSSHEGREAGYLAALFRASKVLGRPLEPRVLEQRSGPSTKDAYEELADQILVEKIDGVVCYQDYTAIGLIIELLTRRTRVPEEVAITGFDNLPIGNSFALGVTTYDYPALTIARQALKVMESRRENPEAPPIKILVPGRLIVRESSRPANPEII
jgi:LacI family transcriptional regulator